MKWKCLTLGGSHSQEYYLAAHQMAYTHMQWSNKIMCMHENMQDTMFVL